MIKKLIKKEKKQLIALFISLISLIIFSLLDNKIDKIFLFFFIGDLIIIFVDVCLELKKYWKNKKDKKWHFKRDIHRSHCFHSIRNSKIIDVSFL